MCVRTLLLCAGAALSLAACQKNEPAGAPAPAAEVAAPAADASVVGRSETPRAPLPIPQLAYAYQYALTAPPPAVRKLVSKHEAVCWAAGPAVCQVVGSSVEEEGKDQVSAVLTLRAQPEWLRTFRSGLDDDTRAVGGRPVNTQTTSDDLAGQMVDTDAEMRSLVILRDRLEDTLRNRQGKLSEVMEVEQQLAAVRARIDAARASAASMKGRVAASTLTISYQSSGVLAPSGSLAPLAEATGDVVRLFVGMVAVLIRAGALLAPVGVLIGLLWWLRRRLRRPSPRPPAA
ncbi:MAG: hypothetical protein DI570_10595 [Phenylobacterium zucineum]|nr:MAG: hypothetical protein DI570_10595 [Phenylobacterium zucineum]